MELGDRIKKYEEVFSFSYPIRFPLILRLDGVHFHSNVKKWNCIKPFDWTLINTMRETTKQLCESIHGAVFGYTQSDEISILIRDDQTLETSPWHGKKINKIVSVSASKTSNIFNSVFKKQPLAEFDCRGFILPEYEIHNYFLWRELDCTRNSIQMLGRSKFSHKELLNKNNKEIQNMLFEKHGINWNELEDVLKRGSCVYQKEQTMNKNGESFKRNKWVVDSLPILNQNKDYFDKYLRKEENGQV